MAAVSKQAKVTAQTKPITGRCCVTRCDATRSSPRHTPSQPLLLRVGRLQAFHPSVRHRRRSCRPWKPSKQGSSRFQNQSASNTHRASAPSLSSGHILTTSSRHPTRSQRLGSILAPAGTIGTTLPASCVRRSLAGGWTMTIRLYCIGTSAGTTARGRLCDVGWETGVERESTSAALRCC